MALVVFFQGFAACFLRVCDVLIVTLFEGCQVVLVFFAHFFQEAGVPLFGLLQFFGVSLFKLEGELGMGVI